MGIKMIFKNIFILLVFVSALNFCDSANGQIEQINVEYVDWSSSSVTGPIDCEDFDYFLSEHHLKKQFTDDDLLRTIDKELKSLQRKQIQSKADSMRVDIRIKSYIQYKTGKIDTLCLGSFAYTVLNNRIMEDNEKLLKLYRKELYPDLK